LVGDQSRHQGTDVIHVSVAGLAPSAPM
jgi:hypothetical protein